jgi:hypothetical protein
MSSLIDALSLGVNEVLAGENTAFFIIWCAVMLVGAVVLVYTWEYVGRRLSKGS